MDDYHDGAGLDGTPLSAGTSASAAGYNTKFLVSTLLVYVAKGDGHIDSVETDRMIGIISTRFNTSGAETMGLLSDAVRAITDGGDLVGKLREISEGLAAAECRAIFDMLLDVTLADGDLADGEARTVEVAGKILGLSEDAIHTGIRAARR
jgi:uncharacterized tellurite resistance protein B-like protein